MQWDVDRETETLLIHLAVEPLLVHLVLVVVTLGQASWVDPCPRASPVLSQDGCRGYRISDRLSPKAYREARGWVDSPNKAKVSDTASTLPCSKRCRGADSETVSVDQGTTEATEDDPVSAPEQGR